MRNGRASTLTELSKIRRGGRKGFTLIELLVVVTIIVVLLSLLTPALDKAVSSAQLAVCLSNQHNIGIALVHYRSDHKQRYPMMDVWWDLMGERGAQGVINEVTERPLNKYLGYRTNGSRVPVAKCPSDIGEPGADKDPTTNTEKIFPHNTPWTSPKHTSLEKPDNKAVNMDWPWHPNRFTYEPRLRWHKPELEERIFSTLFADGHADLLNMDKRVVDPKWGGGATAYNPSRAWW